MTKLLTIAWTMLVSFVAAILLIAEGIIGYIVDNIDWITVFVIAFSALIIYTMTRKIKGTANE